MKLIASTLISSGFMVRCMIVILFFTACRKKEHETGNDQFDVFLVAGQSNTLNGAGIIPGIDSSSGGVWQLGRHHGNDLRIIEAIEPLDHWHKRPGKIGFALTFAKLYKDSMLASGRKVLLVACGMGSTGFVSNEWNKTDYLYEDAIKRVNWALEHFPGSKFRAVLWHQGENDVKNGNYQAQLEQMIKDMRKDIKGWEVPQIFIAGGMVPYWVSKDPMRKIQQDIIRSLPDRQSFIGYADPEQPLLIQKNDNASDEVHYDANGQREMGRRYFSAYRKLRP